MKWVSKTSAALLRYLTKPTRAQLWVTWGVMIIATYAMAIIGMATGNVWLVILATIIGFAQLHLCKDLINVWKWMEV